MSSSELDALRSLREGFKEASQKRNFRDMLALCKKEEELMRRLTPDELVQYYIESGMNPFAEPSRRKEASDTLKALRIMRVDLQQAVHEDDWMKLLKLVIQRDALAAHLSPEELEQYNHECELDNSALEDELSRQGEDIIDHSKTFPTHFIPQ